MILRFLHFVVFHKLFSTNFCRSWIRKCYNNGEMSPKHKRQFFDVESNKSAQFLTWYHRLLNRGKTINLKPALWRRYPFVVVGFALAVMLVVFVVRDALTNAEVVDFYPGNCLGTWQNPANAQGRPEMLDDAETVLSSENSAVFPVSGGESSTAQIFCGGFIPQDFEPRGTVKNIGLTLYWQIEAPAVPVVPGSSAETDSTDSSQTDPADALRENQADPPPADPVDSLQADSTSLPPDDLTDPPEENSSSTTAVFQKIVSSLWRLAFADEVSSTDSTVSPPTNSTETSGDPLPDSLPQAEPENSAQTGSADTPATSLVPNDNPPLVSPESQQSEQADSTGSASDQPVTPIGDQVPVESSSTVIILPPIEAPLEPVPPESTSTPMDSTALPQEADVISSSSVIQEQSGPRDQLSFPPDENFMKISYSTDGQNWAELQKVNQNNWPNLTIAIPITDWEELKNLQIQIAGIPTSVSSVPKVFLEGMFLETHYELPPAFAVTGSELTAENAEKEQVGQNPNENSSEGGILETEPEARPEIKIYDPGAKHTCAVKPFSQGIKKGSQAVYDIAMKPSFTNALYDLTVGDLPSGISAAITAPSGAGAVSSTAVFRVTDSAESGSFDVVIVYRERQEDGNVLSNFCQMNFIVEN